MEMPFWLPPPQPPLPVDGACTQSTKDAIREYQSRVMKAPKPDGRIDPGGATLRSLRDAIPSGLDAVKLLGIMPAATVTDIDKYAALLFAGMEARAINTSLRQAHFLAQLGHESMSFFYSEETASGAAYEGRANLGNTEPGDGVRFKGRGLIQLTGRANYTAYGASIGEDFLTDNNPARVATEPRFATDVSTWFWETHNLNPLADADNHRQVCIVVNGRNCTTFREREAFLLRAKFFLGI